MNAEVEPESVDIAAPNSGIIGSITTPGPIKIKSKAPRTITIHGQIGALVLVESLLNSSDGSDSLGLGMNSFFYRA